MATRSTIALEYADGTVGQIYCHWDGYLAHNGKILQNYYTDPFKVRKLLDGGDTSTLDNTVEGCDFYTKRGEDLNPQRMYKDFNDYAANGQDEEYDYILRPVDGVTTWFVRCYATEGRFVTFAEAREMEALTEDEDY